MHNLEVSETGKVAFALRGQPAWHGLANHIWQEGEHVSTSQMLEGAMLSNWNVRLEAVEFPADYRAVSESFMVVRDNPFDKGTDVLAVVGDRYRVYQNEQLFAFGDNLLDGGASWESAGSIKNGRQVFGSLRIDREIVIDPSGVSDVVNPYLLVTTSHDGSASIQALTTPVRVVCQNTLNMALEGAKQQFKVRHTAGTEGRVEEARHALGLAHKHLDAFEDMATKLYQKSITDQQFDDIFVALYPMPDVDQKASLTRWTEKFAFTRALYLNSPTQQGITGTAWGALNAITERIDWFRGKDGSMSEGLSTAASGFEAGVNGQKAKALAVVRELVGV